MPLFDGAAAKDSLRQTYKKPSIRRGGDGRFNIDNYDVREVSYREALDFVTTHHYSGSYPAAKVQYGVWYRSSSMSDYLVGVGVLSNGAPNSLENAFPTLKPRDQSLDLGRFVLVDEVPANGETRIIRRMGDLRLAQLKAEAEAENREFEPIMGLTAFSDMVPRETADGELIFPGHWGTIYQASNAIYTGKTNAKISYLFRDGTVLDPTGVSKIFGNPPRAGYEGRLRMLEAHDVPLPRAGETRREWQERAVQSGALRRFAHPGNLRYCLLFGDPVLKRELKLGYLSYPYPKKDALKSRLVPHGAVEVPAARPAEPQSMLFDF